MGKQAAQPERDRPWDGVLRREIDVELRAVDGSEERSFEVIASTEDLDSHGDVVKQFWDLSRFSKNGPVLWNHNIAMYLGGDAEDTLPIGKAEARIEGKKLVAKITLLKGTAEQEPLVDKIWRRVEQKVLRAVSVGFRPGQVTRVTNKDGSTKHFELGSAERPNELRELSIVPMGSNPAAVAKSLAWEREQLSREAAPAADQASNNPKAKTMDIEQLQKQLEQAKIDLGVAQKALTTEQDKVKTLETQLTAEKALSKKLGDDLEKANGEIAKAKTAEAKSVLDSMQGKKFAPAEREEIDSMVKDLGLDRVQKYLEKRPDITITQPVEGVDKSLKSPPSVEGSTDASADIANEATKGL